MRGIDLYVAAWSIAAIGSAFILDWQPLSLSQWAALGSLILLGVFAEAVAINLSVAESKPYSTITFIPFFASVVMFHPSAGVLVAAATISVSEFALRRKPLLKRIFNLSQWTVASYLSSTTYAFLLSRSGGIDGPLLDSLARGAVLIPFFVFALTFFLINYLAVAGAIALSSSVSFWSVLKNVAGTAGANLLYGVLVSPLALLVAALGEYFWGFLIVAMLPLIFVRSSYKTNLLLKRANEDLLKALVKAIETRDPYTSGHSLRVSALAKRIARALGLPPRQVNRIETAALLHDIGKIDAVYTGILRKPDTLSDDERSVMESHVTKGVELLASLSSLEPAIIAAVRHHHEREDGKGYPDGLKSSQIPIGAKIIKVCDAVDAMLSDRPYRGALSLKQVREQLVTYAGTQFDVRVVQCIISSEILSEHQLEIIASKDNSPMSALDGHFPPSNGGEIDMRDPLRTVLDTFRGTATRGG